MNENNLSIPPENNLPKNLQEAEFRSGFITLIGRPNSGKSTLLNTVLAEQLSIVTALPQTTRNAIKGILNEPGLQIIFIDTPGIHRGDHLLNKSMFSASTRFFNDEGIDLICYLVDISRPFGAEEDLIADLALSSKVKVCIIFNKKDASSSPQKAMARFFERYPKLSSLPNICISAIKPEASAQFLALVRPLVPIGPQYYPTDELSDSNMRFFAAEYLRKHIIQNTDQEVPHASCVEITGYRETEKQHQIQATIHVETDGQKGIIIGKKGMLIRKIRTAAEKELSALADSPVSIECHVTVSPHWRDDERFLRELGINTSSAKKKPKRKK